MIYFENLSILHKHHNYITKTLNTQNFFIVGGSIRDILLGITKNPIDIDIAMPGTPDEIWNMMNYDNKKMSRFRTKKFGTMTFLPKNKKEKNLNINTQASYEITPLRTEGGYEDFRHPGEIVRSDSVILDAQRRDFTINCIYRYGTTNKKRLHPQNTNKNTQTIKDDKDLAKKLKQYENIYLIKTKTIILQNNKTIEQLFVNGVFQEEYFQKIFSSITLCDFYLKKSDKQDISNNIQTSIDSRISILIDPFQGIQDILLRKICAVGSPEKRFTEDALRIIRGIRFPNTLNQKITNNIGQSGFDFEKKTREAMQKHANLVKYIAKERIHQELLKVFTENNPFGYISLINELQLIKILFPSLAYTKNNIQPTRYHPFDTFNHTLLTLHSLQSINSDYLLKFAMLYHDVGKPIQYAYISKQKSKNTKKIDMSNYKHHTEIGLPLAKKDLQNLGFTKKEIEVILRYIRWHHRPGEILDGKIEKRSKKLKKMISEVGIERTLKLMDMTIADRMGQFNPLQAPATDEIQQLKFLAQDIYDNEGRFTSKDLLINGNDIIKEYNMTPGPALGKLLKQIFERVLTDVKKRNNKKAIFQQIKSLLKN